MQRNCPKTKSALFSKSALWAVIVLLFAALFSQPLNAGTLTIHTNTIAPTPELLAYNSGHFHPGSNTKDWWRYAGVSGARVFLTASIIEATDDISGRGDGVFDEASFLSRKAQLRADPLNTNYINWPYFTNRYNTIAMHGANRLQPSYILAELRKLGVQIDINISASQSFFVILDTNDWAGKWELWQHYYAQAFYLGRGFDVQRYQMFNEPDHSSAGGLTQADYLQRLQLSSDAVQSALADVNLIFGKSLVPKMLAPVITTSSYNTWAQLVVNNRHINFLGQSNANFRLLQQYDYHQYNSSPATFGANLANLRNSLSAAMSPEPAFPVSISEFNVHTAATFDGMAETLDSPTKYPRLGAIFVQLVQNGISEMYNFKFSQTDGDVGDNYPVRKNGMHYVDNGSVPYNIGGITRAGEVWRLFNKAFAPGRQRKGFTADASLNGLSLLASYDPASARYFIFSANDSWPDTQITLNLSALNIPQYNAALIEEVSETFNGTVSRFTAVSNGSIGTVTQKSNSVWLITISARAQQLGLSNVPALTVYPSEDVTVKDGANKNLNFAGQTNLLVRNDPANADNRSVAYVKFSLPAIYPPDVQHALLSFRGSTLVTNAVVQSHVFGLGANHWSQGSLTWANAPNLSQNVTAGAHITNQFVNGLGDTAFFQGQLLFGSTNLADQLIEVTSFIRTRTNYQASFLVAQEPRWNVALPSLAAGDIQPDGLRLVSSEGGSAGPRLFLVLSKDTDSDGLGDESETNIFNTDPNDSDTDNDGFSDGEEVLVSGTNPLNGSPSAPFITSHPLEQVTTNGGIASFSVSAGGTPPLRYQWYFNATNILAGATNSTFLLSNVQPSQAGNYRVTVTNASGSTSSSNASLIVTSAPPQAVSPLPIYEPFSYSAGSSLATQGGWLLNSGTSGTLEAGNLEVAGLMQPEGNRLSWGSSSMSLRLPLNTNLTTGDIFFSFAMRVDTLGGSFVSEGTLAGFTTGTGTSFGSKINIRPNGSAYQLGISKGGGSTFGGWISDNLNVSETHFVVGRYRFNHANGTDDLCDLWLNPPVTSFGANSPPVATIPGVGNGGTDLGQIDRVFFRSGGSTSSPAKLVADELRVGFTWASVTAPLRPALSVQLSNSTAVLSWPLNAPGFALERALTLSPPAWSPVTNAVTIAESNYSVTISAARTNEFFRLRQ